MNQTRKVTIINNTILDKLTDLKYLKLGALNGDNNGISLLLDAGTLIAYFNPLFLTCNG